MKFAAIAAVLFSFTASTTQAAAAHDGLGCVAKILHAEELPYAPFGYWLVRVTLEIVPSTGKPFITTVQHNVPWQQSSPRKGEKFAVNCDTANAVIY